MNTRAVLIGVVAVLAVVVVVVVAWLLLAPSARQPGVLLKQRGLIGGTNPVLDLRYSYNSTIFTPAEYDAHAEYPLRLDGQGFSFYGKRIRGAGLLLVKDPSGILYDFVGSEHLESMVAYYKLEPVGEPLYEDAQIGGKLGLHQQAQYNATAESMWPHYFPEEFQTDLPPATGYVEGWAVFTSEDLFFFQAVSSAPLDTSQRQACLQVMDSMQFNAVLGSGDIAAQPETRDGKPAPESDSSDNAKAPENVGEKSGEDNPAPEAGAVPGE